MAEPASVAASGVSVSEDGRTRLRDISLALRPGDIVTILGPAGAGKTALLRVLAGFIRPQSGQVLLAQRDAARLPPRKRGLALVEHGLGLFGRMTVGETLAWVAHRRALPASLLQAAGLAEAADLLPASLAPGQKARLAIARALASMPAALLLDEPARGLEWRDCEALFTVIRTARAGGMGILYATDDPRQALALGDRVAVLVDGAVRQESTPQSVYEDPADPAVAVLTGPVNRLPGVVEEQAEDGVLVRLATGSSVEARGCGHVPGARCLVFVRPERIAVAALPPEQMGAGSIAAVVDWLTFHGDHVRIGLRAGDAAVTATRPAGASLQGIAPGQMVSIAWQPHHAIAFPQVPK